METQKRNKAYRELKKFFYFLHYKLFFLKQILTPRQFIYLSSFLVGVSSAFAVIVLKFFAHKVYETTQAFSYLLKLPYVNSILPIVGILLTVFITKKFLDGSIQKGTAQIMLAIANKSSRMPSKQMYAQIITSSFTVGMGGSAGLESPIAITGAAFGSNYASNFRLDYKERTLLLACGVAAGISAAFNAPIAGVLFAIEVILADMSVTAFIPLLIAAASGALVSTLILKEGILLSFNYQLFFNYQNTFYYIILGVLAGIVSVYHARLFRRTEHLISRVFANDYAKALLGASLLAFLIFLFPNLFGEGYESIKVLANNQGADIIENSLFKGFKENQWMILLFVSATIAIKAIATGLTLGSGGNGGNFAPSLFVGSNLGYFVAKFFTLIGVKNLPVDNFTVVGMAALLSGLFHAPLTAIFLIAEITGGYGLIVPLMIVSSISFAISRKYDRYSMDIFPLAKKGVVFTTNKDRNILNRIELHHILYNDIVTLQQDFYWEQVRNTFIKSPQQFIPILDEENKITGVIELKSLNNMMLLYNKVEGIDLKEIVSEPTTVAENTDANSMIKLMTSQHIDYLLITRDEQYIGYVTKNNILEEYRNFLKKLRVE